MNDYDKDDINLLDKELRKEKEHMTKDKFSNDS
jgi:hypothetical protein